MLSRNSESSGAGAMAWPFLIVHCQTRLLSSGSKGRFWRARTLIFIPAIRGVHLFAPYQRRGWWAARSPSSGEPACPLLRDDPDHVRQAAAAVAAALLDGEKAQPSRLSDRVLNHPATDP